MKKGDKVLSIGAGIGGIEKMLQTELGVQITIVDFAEIIEQFRPLYERYNMTPVTADLSKDELPLPKEHYDMLLQSEVIEHLPVAPYDQIMKFKPYIRKGGLFVVTTPNLGSVLHLASLMAMQPIFVEPEKMFSPVGVENQGVHRREYLPVEIKDAFTKAGFDTVHVSYFYYTYQRSLKLKVLYFMGHLVKRFRPGMLLVGKKK